MAREVDIQDEARADMIAACAKWMDQWDQTAGAIITGFVVIIESICGQDAPVLTWASGDGSPVEGNAGGLSRWRIDGMVREVSNEMAAITINFRGDPHAGEAGSE